RVLCPCGLYLDVPSLDEIRRRQLGTGGEPPPPDDVISDEPLRQPHVIGIYIILVAILSLLGLPAVVFTQAYFGTTAAAGIFLMFVGHIWLFSQIFAGNPIAGLVTLIPLIGAFLALQFIIDHFRIAWRPLLCELVGYVLYFGAAFSYMPR